MISKGARRQWFSSVSVYILKAFLQCMQWIFVVLKATALVKVSRAIACHPIIVKTVTPREVLKSIKKHVPVSNASVREFLKIVKSH